MMKNFYTLLMLVFFCASVSMAQTIRYVTEVGSGDKLGGNWSNASDDLQAIIDGSSPGDEVWVAKGTYYPTKNIAATSTGDARDQSFVMKAGVKVRGGFVGNEDAISFNLNDRNFILNETILSGDLGTPNDISDNAHHVVIVIIGTFGTTEKVILDGFTIQDGNADGTADEFQVVGNGSLTWGVARNVGAGISLRGADASRYTEFHNLVVKNNHSADNGGAVHLWMSNVGGVSFNNILFEGNTSGGLGGSVVYMKNTINTPSVYFSNIRAYDNHTTGSGAIYTDGNGSASTLTLVISNSIFYGNTAQYTGSSPVRGGAAMHIGSYSTATVINSTFYKNKAQSIHGAVTFNDGASTTLNLYNNIFDGNIGGAAENPADIRRAAGANGAYQNIKNNILRLALASSNNRTVENDYVLDSGTPEPLFASTTEGDYNFLWPIENSFAIDKGDNTLYTNNVSDVTTAKDLLGNNRLEDANIDLGAIEWSSVLPVKVSSFTAKLVNNRTQLKWGVGTEENVHRYEIERSQNGTDFTTVATVRADGLASYSTTDNNPAVGVNYYRLVTVDNDGTRKAYDHIQTITVASLAAEGASVYPNPVIGNEVNVSLGNAEAGTYGYKIVSTTGSVAQQGTLSYDGTSAVVSVGSLPAGVYVLQFSNGTQAKLIKQ